MVESADDAAPHLELAAVEEEGSSSQLNRQGNAENDPIASDFVLITRNKKSFLSPVVLAAAAVLACTAATFIILCSSRTFGRQSSPSKPIRLLADNNGGGCTPVGSTFSRSDDRDGLIHL